MRYEIDHTGDDENSRDKAKLLEVEGLAFAKFFVMRYAKIKSGEFRPNIMNSDSLPDKKCFACIEMSSNPISNEIKPVETWH
jgi:hypothetical protein